MGLVYGIGYPPFRGGVLHSVDKLGVQKFCDAADKLKDLGPLYHVTDGLRKMATTGETYYPKPSAMATSGAKS